MSALDSRPDASQLLSQNLIYVPPSVIDQFKEAKTCIMGWRSEGKKITVTPLRKDMDASDYSLSLLQHDSLTKVPDAIVDRFGMKPNAGDVFQWKTSGDTIEATPVHVVLMTPSVRETIKAVRARNGGRSTPTLTHT